MKNRMKKEYEKQNEIKILKCHEFYEFKNEIFNQFRLLVISLICCIFLIKFEMNEGEKEFTIIYGF